MDFLFLAKPNKAVLQLFLADMSISTSQALMVSKLQEVEILQSRMVQPRKVNMLHLVILQNHLIKASNSWNTYWGGRPGPGAAVRVFISFQRLHHFADLICRPQG